MKKIFSMIMGLLALVLSFAFRGEFYSSMTKVDYEEGSKTLKITTKINADHLMKVLKSQANTPNFKNETEKYMSKNFNIEINGVPKNIKITDSQINGETLWVYAEVANISEISKIKIRNTILLEAYPKQFNVVNIAYKHLQKTMNFQKGKEVSEVNF